VSVVGGVGHAARMGKYGGFSDLLQRQVRTTVEFTFAELDDVVPGGLPPSAHKYAAWWSNETEGTHSQTRSWMSTGWMVERVNLQAGRVTFTRAGSLTDPEASTGQTPILDDPLPAPTPVGRQSDDDRFAAFATVVAMLSGSFTQTVRELQDDLRSAGRDEAAAAVASRGFDSNLLAAALQVRQHVGRINDLVHAAVISAVLPKLLQPGETFKVAPSLAAGNNPLQQYDVETTERRAEFKVSIWRGADVARKRSAFQDLAHLAAAPRDRRAELYVVGPATEEFFRGATSNVSWGLDRGADSTRRTFADNGWNLDMTIKDFRDGPAGHVDVIDLTAELLPELRPFLAGA
jgi:hypothetical protein